MLKSQAYRNLLRAIPCQSQITRQLLKQQQPVLLSGLRRQYASASTHPATDAPTAEELKNNRDYFFNKDGKRRVTVDFEYPDPMKDQKIARKAFAAFCVVMAITLGGIIKYEDANSAVVTSTLYTLRRSQIAHQELGDNISFSSLLPWISGSLSTAHGNVTFWYNASGTKNDAVVKFSSVRDPATRKFSVHEWSITPTGKPKISLMEEDFRPFIPSKNEEPTSRHKSE